MTPNNQGVGIPRVQICSSWLAFANMLTKQVRDVKREANDFLTLTI